MGYTNATLMNYSPHKANSVSVVHKYQYTRRHIPKHRNPNWHPVKDCSVAQCSRDYPHAMSICTYFLISPLSAFHVIKF